MLDRLRSKLTSSIEKIYAWRKCRKETANRNEMWEIYILWRRMKKAYGRGEYGQSHLLFNECSDKLRIIGKAFEDLNVPYKEIFRHMPPSWW